MIKQAFIKIFLTGIALIGTSLSTQAQFSTPPFDLSSEFNHESQTSGSSSSTSSLISSVTSVAPGETFQVALKLSHPKDWHSYYNNDGIGISKSPAIKWDTPEGLEVSPLTFPTPKQFKAFELNNYGYEGTNYFITNIAVPSNFTSGEKATITADASWQLCKVSCKNEKGTHTIEINCTPTTVNNPNFISELASYQKKYIPSSAPESWKINALEADNKVEITVNTDGELGIL